MNIYIHGMSFLTFMIKTGPGKIDFWNIDNNKQIFLFALIPFNPDLSFIFLKVIDRIYEKNLYQFFNKFSSSSRF